MKILKNNDMDNVAIVVTPEGIAKGETIVDGVTAGENIAFGHKVTLTDLSSGMHIIRYGHVIGTAQVTIPAGCNVLASSITTPELRKMTAERAALDSRQESESIGKLSFEGYRNSDGSVGTKNLLGVSTSVQCVAGVVDHAVERIKRDLLPMYPHVDGVVALKHNYGCGVAIHAPQAAIPIRTVQNLAKNPNFGGEVMIVGLGCEKLDPHDLLPEEKTHASVLCLQDKTLSGFSDMIDGILAQAKLHLQRLNARRRVSCPLSDLVVGVQCGGSDALSGITANPVVGYAADLIVGGGGSVVFSEVTEIRDAAHLLIPRCINEEVANKLIHELEWYDTYLAAGDVDRDANPSPGNKAGGLSNVVEKALGSVAKSGTSPIVDVLAPGERIKCRGLVFAATPASDFICGTLQLAAGIGLQVFTTGRGTPYGLEAAPVIKVCTNTALANRWHDLIDVDAGRMITSGVPVEELGRELFHFIIEVASGRTTAAADRLGLHNPLALFNPGPVT